MLRRARAVGHGRAFAILSLADPALRFLFFLEYPEPVRDDAALLQHPNTALGLESVWLTDSVFDALHALSPALAAGTGGGVALSRGAVVRSERPSAARVAGVTIRVRSVDAAREVLRKGTGEALPIRSGRRGRSLLVPPVHTHGIWIEFLEPGRVP